MEGSEYKEGLLALAARRVSSEPGFMGYMLSRYADAEGLGERSLIAYLGISHEGYPRLCLCRAPDKGAADFPVRVRHIASSVGADAGKLAQVIRYVEGLDALRNSGRPEWTWAGNAVLMAARDADIPEEETPSSEDPGEPTDERG